MRDTLGPALLSLLYSAEASGNNPVKTGETVGFTNAAVVSNKNKNKKKTKTQHDTNAVMRLESVPHERQQVHLRYSRYTSHIG